MTDYEILLMLDPELPEERQNEIVSRIRLQHHAAKLEAGAPLDNLVDPAELPPLTRRELRESFRAIAQAQKRLGVYVPSGI